MISIDIYFDGRPIYTLYSAEGNRIFKNDLVYRIMLLLDNFTAENTEYNGRFKVAGTIINAKLAILATDNIPGIIRTCHDSVLKLTMVAVQKIAVSCIADYKKKQFEELASPGKNALQYDDEIERLKTHPYDTFWEEGEHLYYSEELNDRDE